MIRALICLLAVILTWDNANDPDIIGYKFYVTEKAGDYSAAQVFLIPANAVKVIDGGARNCAEVSNWQGTKKRWGRLTAYNGIGESTPSNEIQIKGIPRPPIKFKYKR